MLDNILKSASALGACERLDKVKNFGTDIHIYTGKS